MSGETRKAVSGWTVDTLKEYFDSKNVDMDLRLTSAIDHVKEMSTAASRSAQTAIDKAELATTSRFESVNEFRATLSDQSDRMMPRVESEQRHRANAERLDSFQQQGILARDALSARLDGMERRMLLREGAETGSDKTKEATKEAKDTSLAQMALVATAVSTLISIVVPFLLAALRGVVH